MAVEIVVEDIQDICARAQVHPDSTLGTQVSTRPMEVRNAHGAMLTFPATSHPGLEPFYEALVELLLERLDQLTDKPKEAKSNARDN